MPETGFYALFAASLLVAVVSVDGLLHRRQHRVILRQPLPDILLEGVQISVGLAVDQQPRQKLHILRRVFRHGGQQPRRVAV